MQTRLGWRCALLAAAAVVLALLDASCGARARPTSLLLITLDTVRADALGCYGAKPALTPALDALARESVLYEAARTVMPATLPAHASMLTGLYPSRHGVRDNSLNALPSTARTLAESAAARGFATGAFVSAKVLDRVFGLDQGFEVYSQPAREKSTLDHPTFATRSGRETAREAATWLANLPAERAYFAWVHLFDAHQPWPTDAAALARSGGNPYLAGVAAADDAVADLIAALRASGRLADTVVIVVGDHGESLGQHGEATHGHMVFDSTLRVPLLVRAPNGERAGERSREIVSVADIHPTACAALGLDAGADLDGESLWRRRVSPERGVYFESYYGYLHFGLAPLAGWVDAGGKYVHSSRSEFYAPHEAPAEERNLLEERAGDVERYRRALEQVAARPSLPAPERAELSAQAVRDLAALGYAASTGAHAPLPHPLAPSDRASPHDSAEALRKVEAAEALMRSGRAAQAAAAFEAVLAEQPANVFAWELLGYCRASEGRFDEAHEALRRALELGPERASVLKALGHALERLEQTEAALAAWERAHELDPSDVDVLRFLFQAAQYRGDEAQSARWRERLVRAQSGEPNVAVPRGAR
jgi:arylsulfatase A-like enzyme